MKDFLSFTVFKDDETELIHIQQNLTGQDYQQSDVQLTEDSARLLIQTLEEELGD